MRRILLMAYKDLRIFLADPVALGLAFIVPFVMIMVFGLVFGNSGSGTRPCGADYRGRVGDKINIVSIF